MKPRVISTVVNAVNEAEKSCKTDKNIHIHNTYTYMYALYIYIIHIHIKKRTFFAKGGKKRWKKLKKRGIIKGTKGFERP